MDKQDGMMLIQLAQWHTAMGVHPASRAVYADDFDPSAATIDDPNVQKCLAWGETLGTLAKNGLMDTDLILDWQWLYGLWERVGPAAEEHRQRTGEAALFENFELLARQQGE